MKVSERALREIYLPAFEKVVVLYKDRLLRFGFELIEYITSLYNCEIEIIDNTENPNSRNLLKIKKLEKQKRRLQRSISRSYEKNKKGESYCKTNNVIKKEKLLLKRNHRLTNIRKKYLNQTISEIVNRKPRFICIEDLVQIITVFSCKLQGKRANIAKKLVRELIQEETDGKSQKSNVDTKQCTEN